MKHSYLKIVACFFALCMMAGCLGSKDKYPMDKSFESFKKEFVNQLWKLNPQWALSVGFHEYDDLIEIPSREARDNKLKIYSALADSLKKFDWKKLCSPNQLDLKLMSNYLDYYKWEATVFKSWEWNPAEYNLGEGFDLVLGNKDRPLDGRLHTIMERLRFVPAYYIAAKANISRPTREHTDLAILQNEGSLSIFETIIPDSSAASTLNGEEKKLLADRLSDAVEAVKDYVSFLKDLRKKQDTDTTQYRSFRIGKEMYDKKFSFEIQSGYSAEQIFEKAKQHKDELHTEMQKLTSQLWSKYFGNKPMPEGLPAVKMMIDTLSVHHCQRDSFLITIKNQIPQLEAFIKQKNLLYLDPTKPLVVRETPAYMEGGGAGASINAPGPYDKNGNTYYNVTPLTGYTAEQAESYLREYNDYILQILNIHEAIPGHYAQLVYSNKSPSLIKSILQNNAMIEGWAVYGERMMLEEGYGGNTPEMWLMYYKWNLRSTLNTILDYSIQCLDMSEQDALNLMINEGFQQQAEAAGKWKRATLSQVQLCCYFTGYTEIYDFRNEYKQKMGEKYNLKDFHEKFLSYGSVPVKFIREQMLEEADEAAK